MVVNLLSEHVSQLEEVPATAAVFAVCTWDSLCTGCVSLLRGTCSWRCGNSFSNQGPR